MLFLSLWISFYLFVAAASLLFIWFRRWSSYWPDRGIVHDKPDLLHGNLRGVGSTKSLREPFLEFYKKYKHSVPFAGFYLSMRIGAVILDLELIKHVLVKDFGHFAYRGNYYNEKIDPVSAHIFNLDGAEWKTMRAKLTPTFTSGKMKFMFQTLVEVGEQFVGVLQTLTAKQEATIAEELKLKNTFTSQKSLAVIDMSDLLARFTTDVIGSCAFGIDCNSLKDPHTHFREMGKKVFTQRRHGRLVFGFAQAYPTLARLLGIKMTPDDVSDFFRKVVYDAVAYREEEGVHRNDFLNILMELKNKANGLSMDQISAQSFLFFLAGFETSSNTMGFALYELASNQEIQAKVRAEIEEVLACHDGQFTYECMRELKYLYQVFCETLRKYSVASVLLRKTVKDYEVPNTKYVIEKGVIVIIPIDAIHRDPEIYPNPEVFDPSRFATEEIAKRHPMTWLPFGAGPRNCIGLRFGEMQTIVGLVMLLKNFKFTLGPQMKKSLEMKCNTMMLTCKTGIYLNVEPIARG